MFSMHSARGRSHAKIILIGEHSVVYGKPAIALPLSEVTTRVRISSVPSPIQMIRSRYFEGAIRQMPHTMYGLQHLISLILNEHHALDAQFELTIKSDLPAERGMGSSAATAVALIRALYNYFGWKLSHTELLQLANVSEIDMHGTPSGLDAATAASTNPIWMVKDRELTPIPIKMDGCLLICDSGIKGRTSEAVASVRARLKNAPHETNQVLDKLSELTLAAKEQLAKNEICGLGKTFDKAQEQLRSLGVSTQTLDHLIHASRTLGSLGSKLTGGGRGGCFICLMPDQITAKKAGAQLKKLGVPQTWVQPLALRAKEEVN
ncbi:mevalonate kinase [Liquorilactobacillus satsumensis]|uniref:mevalonate kinase n=1 Tax=Liquorilactobacillus satsumensis TaxID=259059 RepID=UPI0039E7A181